MSRYRCAIVGCGPRAEMHALAYKLVEGAELVACCDLDEARREAFAQKHGLRPYGDIQDMARRERPDLVHLVTMPDTRVPLMTAVSDLGIPACIVEKPIAAGVSDWKFLVELARRTKTKFAVGAQFRYHEDLGRCRDAVQSGDIGELLLLELSAGMNIANQGVHILDWAMSLNLDQPPRRVMGFCSGVDRRDRGHLAPESTAARIEFANGVEGLWTNGPTALRVFRDDTTWKHCRVVAHGTHGHVQYEEFGSWRIQGKNRSEMGSVTLDQAREGNLRAQANLTGAVTAWIRDDSAVPGTNLVRSLQQWNAILGVWASALERRPVDLPFDPPEDLVQRALAAFGGPEVKS